MRGARSVGGRCDNRRVEKIPTVFRRDPADLSRVLPEVHPDCQWVLDGEGVPTRKYDGTCMRLDEHGAWWARREVKPGKAAPENFHALSTDPETGKTVGWEPAEQSPFVKAWREAAEQWAPDAWTPGTYELIGPKVQGNPERCERHFLQRHADAERIEDAPRTFDDLMGWLMEQGREIEGIVWHHPDGRMAKLKVRDAERTVAALL